MPRNFQQTDNFTRQKKASSESSSWLSRIGIIIGILIGLFTLLIIVVFFVGIIGLFSNSGTGIESGNVAVVPINGVIVSSSGDFFMTGIVDSAKIVKQLEELDGDASIDAIVLEINSPGGSPVASDEIGAAVKKLRKPTVAIIRDIGASGGYWIASCADYIIANRMSMTGSIGVNGAGFGFEEFIDHYNITYRQIISGDMKDAGTPFRAMTSQERSRIQQLLDTIHEEFILEVSRNRNLSIDHVRSLADGFVLLGSEALDAGLVDELGDMSSAKIHLENILDTDVIFARYDEQPGLFDILTQARTDGFYHVGRGIGDSFTTTTNNDFSVMLR